MSTKPQLELFLENENGTQQVAYPLVEADHVSLSNGMDIDTMIAQDVSMPTVAHEDLSFKVGVGDQDVSSAIVDGSVAEMTIKGQTYQNILPEPSTHVLSNNKEMFKVNEGLDPNVEIVDGISKSAILSGNTLVNVKPKTSLSKWGTSSYDSESGICTLNGSNSGIRFNIDLLKTSTKYLVIFDIVELPTFAVESDAPIKLTLGHNSYNYLNINSDELKVGTLIKTITTHNEFTEKITIGNRGEFSTPIKMRFMIIEYQEGIENWDIPYFEGLQSVKMPVLTTTGKNLFDGEFELDKYLQKDGTLGGSANWATTKNYISVRPNTTYTQNIRMNSSIAYVFFYDKNKNIVGAEVGSDVSSYNSASYTTPNNCYYIKTCYDYSSVGNHLFQVEEGSTATKYEPYKSNILHTPEEVVLRSLPNGVKDTLNLMTGEYVQRIGETTLDGSSRNDLNYHAVMKEQNGQFFRMIINQCSFYNKSKYGNCDKLTFYHTEKTNVPVEGVFPYSGNDHFYIQISTSRISGADSMEGSSSELKTAFRDWLQANPITIQYELVTPIIRTVDLSSSGNWEKVVLDGSTTGFYKQTGGTNRTKTSLFVKSGGVTNARSDSTGNKGFNDSGLKYCNAWMMDEEGIQIENGRDLRLSLNKDKLPTDDENGLKQYLSQNPITIWYQTDTQKDTTQVKEPVFCKNGHIIQSSGAENSLIPTLDYQAKTSNSYVMDLMKANTIYTMKNDSANGKFTIDGTQYNLVTNGKLKTPTTLTDKLLVINGSASNTMILEGDLTSKTIPYFKGIKSAFEDESKIEVLSTGKNLYPYGDVNFVPIEYNWYDAIGTPKMYGDIGSKSKCRFLLEKGTYYFSHDEPNNIEASQLVDDNENILLKTWSGTFTLTDDAYLTLRIKPYQATCTEPVSLANVQIVQKTAPTSYEPYKSNCTKIPLLSSLRSLPYGVCDELIIDRENNKAKIIQRVGKVVLDGKEDWTTNSGLDTTKTTFFYLPNSRIPNTWERIFTGLRCITNNRFVSTTDRTSAVNQKIEWISGGDSATGMIQILIKKERLSTPDVSGFKQWLSENPITIQYELETPIVTEVDLEGFPYVYKDGHIFLNGEIAPVTEIKYSINQQHQIEASNQDIMRHQKEIDYLYKLIGEYVRVDYKNTLLSLNLELK